MVMETTKKRVFSGKSLFRFGLMIAVPLMGIGVCSAYQFADARKKEAETALGAKRPTQTIGVGAIGRLEPGWKVYQVSPSTSAERSRVETLCVEEGDQLKAGALIAVLDTNKIRQAGLKEAQAQVSVSRAKLAQVKSGAKSEEIAAQAATVEQLKASLRRTEADFKRAELMSRNGALSAEEFDQKQSQTQIARATLKQAEATLGAIKAVRPEDIAVAEAELTKAEAGIAKAEADLETTLVRAPIGGRILKVHSRPGEKIGESGLVEIGDTESMHAVAEVYEKDMPRVKLGQRAMVRLQSLKEELKGEVVQVGWKVGRKVVLDNDPVKDTDARVVEVRIKLDKNSSAKVAGLSFSRVEIRIETPENQ